MKSIVPSIIILLISVTTAFSQKVPFTPAQLSSFEKESSGLVEEYLNTVQHLVASPNAPGQSDVIENIKSFFVPGSEIQVIDSKKHKSSFSLDTYLTVVLPGYKKRYADAMVFFKQVVIDGKSLKLKVDKHGNKTYEGDFSYTQITCFTYKGKQSININSSEIGNFAPDFCDSTVKTGKFVLMQQYSPTNGDGWEIRLGNILVKTEEVTVPRKN